MKPKASLRFILQPAGLALLLAPSAFAQGPYYWDNTSPLSTSGFGAAGGIWGTDAKWSTSSAGTAATGITSPTTSDTLNFGTGTVGLANGTIAVSGTVSSGNMIFGSASGNITFTGGTINTAAAVTINTGGNTIWYDTTVLSGATSGVTYTGGGVLRISGNNSAIAGGNFNVNQGELLITNTSTNASGANALGGADGWTVQLGNTSGSSAATLSLGNSINIPNPITVRAGSTGAKTLTNNSGNINGTFSGVITANDSLTIAQDTAPTGTPGSLTVNNAGNTVALNKTVTFSLLTSAALNDSSAWGGSGKLAYSGSGSGTINVSGAKTYTGGATLGGMTGTGSVVVNASSAGAANAPTSGPFGTGTLSIAATKLRATGADRTIHNSITFTGAPTFSTAGAETSLIFTGDASLGATRTMTVDTGTTVAGKFVEFQGAISGSGFGITKSGTGVLVLSGENTYSGNTTVNAGTLTLGNNLALQNSPLVTTGAGTVTLGAGVTTPTFGGFSGATGNLGTVISSGYGDVTSLTLNVGTAVSYGGEIADGATGMNLLKTGAATQTLSGTNSYTGTTAIQSGTITIASNSALGATAGNTVVSSGARLFTQTANLSTAEPLTIAGAGIGGANGAIQTGGSATGVAFTGGITLSGDATIQADSGTGTTFSGGIDTVGNALTVNGGGTTAINTSGITGAGGSLIKNGGGTLNLNVASDYTGLTTVNGGALVVQNANALGTTAAGVVVNGTNTASASNARLALSGGITVTGEAVTISGLGNFTGALISSAGSNVWAGPVTIGAAGTRIGANALASLEVSGTIDSGLDAHGLAIRTSDLTGVVILSGANTYLGNTNLVVGKLQLGGADNRLPVGTMLNLTGTTLANSTEFDLNGFNQEVAGLSLGGGSAAFNSVNNSSLTASTLTVNTAAPSTYGGILEGNLALTKTGTDTLTLTGTSNTYAGATNVNQGTLIVDGNISTSVLTSISDNATLGGGGTVGDLAFAGGSFFDIFDAVDNTDSLASTSITFSTTGFGIDNLVSQGFAVDWSSIASGTYTLITGALDSTNLDNFGLANAYNIGGGRSAYFQSGSLQLVVVPEPHAALLGGIGVLLIFRRRRA